MDRIDLIWDNNVIVVLTAIAIKKTTMIMTMRV